MLARRSFLRKLGAAIAIIALAPEICFKKHFPAPKYQEPLDLEELFKTVYAIKKQRELVGIQDHIDCYYFGSREDGDKFKEKFTDMAVRYCKEKGYTA